jgi:predicted RNA-binding protein YlxR (DUF448 family)
MCALTRQLLPVERLIKFVTDADGVLVPDLKQRLPGHCVWVKCSGRAIALSIKDDVFSRLFPQTVIVEENLAENIAAMLKRDALSRLGLAKKAGQLVSGFIRIEKAIVTGRVIGLLHAREAAEDGCRKLTNKLSASLVAGGEKSVNKTKIVQLFDKKELSLALGLENVIHVGLMEGGASRAFWDACDRLAFYMMYDGE